MITTVCIICGDSNFSDQDDIEKVEKDTGFIYTDDYEWVCRDCVNELYHNYLTALKEANNAKKAR